MLTCRVTSLQYLRMPSNMVDTQVIAIYRALPGIGVSLLIATTALDQYRLDIAPFSIRTEHIALALVGGVWIIRSVSSRERPTLLPDDALLALYLCVALASSIFNAPNLRASLQFLGIMGIGTVMYW